MSGQILDTNKYSYIRIKLQAPDKPTVYSANNADAISRIMLAMTKNELITVSIKNKMDERLSKHYNKNAGHLRMIVGQALRSMVKKHQSVLVRGVTITALDQAVDWPFGYKEVAVICRKK